MRTLLRLWSNISEKAIERNYNIINEDFLWGNKGLELLESRGCQDNEGTEKTKGPQLFEEKLQPYI